MNQGGDVLARGGQSATFPAAEPGVSQEKWNDAVGGDQVESFLERLRKRAMAEGVSEEEFERQRAEAQRVVDEKIAEEKRLQAAADAKIKFRAVQDRVIVQRIEVSDTQNGFYIPDDSKEKPYEGTVVAVGPGRYYPTGEFVPVTLQVGEHVVFGKFSGTEIKIGSKDLLVLREEDIFVVKEKSND